MSKQTLKVHFVFCLLVLSCNSLHVKELHLNNLVLIKEGYEVCIPQEYKKVYMRIRHGLEFTRMLADLRKAEKGVGSYGAKGETWTYANYRHCAQSLKVGGLCPLAALKEVTGNTAAARWRAISKFWNLDAYVAKMANVWNLIPSEFKIPVLDFTHKKLSKILNWPTNLNATSNSRHITQNLIQGGKKLILPILSIVNRLQNTYFLDNFTVESGAVKLPEPLSDKLLTRFHQLADQAETALEVIKTYINMKSDFDENKFPMDLFPPNEWCTHLYDLEGTPTAEQSEEIRQMIQFVHNFPLTTARKNDKCEPRIEVSLVPSNCYIDIETLVPFYPKIERYKKLEFHATPVKIEEQWKKVMIPKNSEVYRQNVKYYISEKGLSCLQPKNGVGCQLCNSDEAMSEVTDKCLTAIFTESITGIDDFELEILTNSPDSLFNIEKEASNEIVISNDQPTDIIEKCRNEETISHIPSTAQISVADNCELKFINPPTVKEVIDDFEIKEVPKATTTQRTTTTLEAIRFSSPG